MKFSTLLLLLRESLWSDSLTLEQFQDYHEQLNARYGTWTVAATYRKCLAQYWLQRVIIPFTCIMILSTGITFLVSGHQYPVFKVALPTAFVSFGLLLLVLYLPCFYCIFLPHLSNVKSIYEARELEGIQKCKKLQPSVTTLLLIQSTLFQLCGNPNLSLSKEHVAALSSQYGVSVRMVDSVLRLILLNQWDRSKERKRTEIEEAIEDAKSYFLAFDMPEALKLLQVTERKILGKR